jgi:hypothetical protein
MFVPDKIWVAANFKENQLDAMRPGQSVTLEIDAYPERTIHGHIASVHGSKRIAKVVLVGAVPPIMLKTGANPEGTPVEVFDGIRTGTATKRSQFFTDLTIPFYGFEGLRESFWLMGMQGGTRAAATASPRSIAILSTQTYSPSCAHERRSRTRLAPVRHPAHRRQETMSSIQRSWRPCTRGRL